MHYDSNHFASVHGMAMVELMVATLIGAILLTGLLQIAESARRGFHLQENLAEIQENGRFAMDSLGLILRQSIFTPEPWYPATEPVGLTDETADGVNRHSDRLGLRTWSERNCFGNSNPELDSSGQATYFLKESVLELSDTGNLAHTCRYGPNGEQLVVQLRRQGLVQGVEDFQVLYAEDLNGDGSADRWVRGAEWQNREYVVGLHIAILLGSSLAVGEPAPRTYNVLDHVLNAPADGKLRRIFSYAQAIRGRRT